MIRKLALEEMDRAATVHRASFDHALPFLAGRHTPEEDCWFYRERMYPICEIWGSFIGQELTGIIAFRKEWIDQLYVLPSRQGQGNGTALLAIAQASCHRLHLWTFQRNKNARRFYEKNGFVAIEETDGAGNEEKEPDVQYRWQAGMSDVSAYGTD